MKNTSKYHTDTFDTRSDMLKMKKFYTENYPGIKVVGSGKGDNGWYLKLERVNTKANLVNKASKAARINKSKVTSSPRGAGVSRAAKNAKTSNVKPRAKKKNPSPQIITCSVHEAKNGSGNFFPILNGKIYYGLKYRTRAGGMNEARRMAKAYKKEVEGMGYKVKIADLKENYWPDNHDGHSKAAQKGWLMRTYMGTRSRSGVNIPGKKLSAPRSANPASQKMTKIYDNVLSIEAKKGSSSQWSGEEFRHNFKTSKGKASVYGLQDGSILIKGDKRLWKEFDY